MLSRHFTFCLLLIVPSQAISQEKPPPLPQPDHELVRQAVWGTSEARKKTLDELRRWPATPERVWEVESVIRAGRKYSPMTERQQTVAVTIDDKRKVNVLVQLPSGYDPSRRFALMIAIGGGPPPNDAGAAVSAKRMLAFWSKPADEAGWIVAAIEDTPSVRLPGNPLRYFILHADHVRAIRDALLAKYAIDCNRIHVTGISLGSNYALAYAAAHPDWFAGIAPVSTEGESREFVVRNLKHVGVYALEGAKDKAIRTIDGPRKMAEILKNFGYPHIYEEEPNRGHEGFMPKYPQVLKWLAERPRPAFPKEIVRLPHPGIILPGKRFYWLEGDAHQAAFTAKVSGNTIEVQAARVRRLTFHLSDRLLDLGAPVIIRVNGRVVHDKTIPRSLVIAVEDAATLNDTERFATARLPVDIPDLEAGEKWLASLAPKVEPSRLPFWEDFAMTTLQEKRPAALGDLEPAKESSGLPAWQMVLRVKMPSNGSPLRAGDLVLGFDHEPLFAGADSLGFLNSYLLRTTAKSVSLQIKRDGKAQEVVIAVRPASNAQAKDIPVPKITEARKDENGFLNRAVESEFQKGKTEIKVLLPDRLEKDRRYPVVYVLPVEAGTESRFGNGLLEAKKLDLHNKYGVIFVLPTFAQLPWYADHPTEPTLRQESYFLKVVVPFVEKQYPAKGRLLLGFSKSGWGAFSLLLRHPDLFDKAAAFDAPLDMDKPMFGMAGIVGTQENFEKYRVAPLLQQRAANLQKGKRLALLGYANFLKHHQAIHDLMERLKIPHEYRDEKKPRHTWDAGWIEDGVKFLVTHPEKGP